jgi:hypothetical protein
VWWRLRTTPFALLGHSALKCGIKTHTKKKKTIINYCILSDIVYDSPDFPQDAGEQYAPSPMPAHTIAQLNSLKFLSPVQAMPSFEMSSNSTGLSPRSHFVTNQNTFGEAEKDKD